MPSEPRLRILVAEVQARCGGLIRRNRRDAPRREADASECTAPAASRGRTGRLETGANASCKRWPRPTPAESPDEWASRAALGWCAEPEVSGRSVIWVDSDAERLLPNGQEARTRARTTSRETVVRTGRDERSPALVIPLEVHGRTRAWIRLWSHRDSAEIERRLASPTRQKSLGSLGDHGSRPGTARASGCARWSRPCARRVETEETRLERRKAGCVERIRRRRGPRAEQSAGGDRRPRPAFALTHRRRRNGAIAPDHDQPGGSRSSHPARFDVRGPPACAKAADLPAVRVAARLGARLPGGMRRRGIRLSSEIDEAVPAAWTDPDALRHLADILIRNAMQATPSGGKIQVGSRLHRRRASLVVQRHRSWAGSDRGRASFRPFLLRAPGRPRTGTGPSPRGPDRRNAGGRLRWSSNPGQGTVFHINLPVAATTTNRRGSASPRPPLIAIALPTRGAPIARQPRRDRYQARLHQVNSLRSGNASRFRTSSRHRVTRFPGRFRELADSHRMWNLLDGATQSVVQTK